MLLARSAPAGEADEIAMNPDIDTRRSAVGGKADVPATWPESPLVARPRHCQGSIAAAFSVEPGSPAPGLNHTELNLIRV